MMKSFNFVAFLGLVLVLAVTASALPAQVLAAGDISECELCRRVVGAAERHFRNNVTTQDGLKRELDRECIFFVSTHNKNVSNQCIAFVDANIGTIFTDISAGKHPDQVCIDIQICGARPSAAASSLAALAGFDNVEAPKPDPCHTCVFIVGRAEHHFRPNETADQLKGHLDKECQTLGQFEGPDAATKCQQIIDANIQTIYADIAAGKRPYDICSDINECTTATGAAFNFLDVLAPAPGACHTCEFIIGRAEHHYHDRNVTDKHRLLTELEHECIQLGHTEGNNAAVQCLDIVHKNIDKIFEDVVAHKGPGATCTDIGECTAASGTPASAASGLTN